MRPKNIIVSALLLFLSSWGYAQTITIDAKLNETTRTLDINQQIQYTNTSADTLKVIYFNNWPNSYRNKNTVLGKRLLEDYDRSFHFAKLQQRGYTDIISLYADNKPVQYSGKTIYSDILKIDLVKPLLPKQTTSIKIHYTVKLPDIELTGYGGDFYNFYLKYWYIIPAVYDAGGWHMMHNLNLDDMYSDLYQYKIDLEVPIRFDLTTNLLIKHTETKNKAKHYTLVCKSCNGAEIYLQTNNDFKSYQTDHVKIFTDIQTDRLSEQLKAQILNRAMDFIESNLGKFPYSKMVVTKVAYDKNPIYGFNQLPKFLHPFNDTFEWDIKVFKALTEKFIRRTFQFNLRKDAWLADGMQTYLMMQYVNTYYKDVKAIGGLSKFGLIKNFNISKLPFNGKYPFVYQFAARQNLDQALQTPTDSLSNFNRKIVNKYKAGMGLQYLEAYLNHDIIKRTLKDFYSKYQLKPVSSNNFEILLKQQTTKPLNWFFDDFLRTKQKIDYTITKANIDNDSIAVTIKNKRTMTTPVALYGLNNKKIVYKKWFNGIDSIKTVFIPKKNIDKVVLNYEDLYPEYNLRNNWKKLNHSLFNRPIQFRFLKDIEDPNYNQVFYNVYGNYNFYDGFLLGPSVYNETFLKKNFLYKITPTYGFKSNTITGSFAMQYRYLPENSSIYQIRAGITGSSFHYNTDLLFSKISPFVSLDFKRKSLRDVGSKSLMMRYVSVNRQTNDFSDPTDISKYNVLNIRYGYSKPEIIRDLRYYFDFQLDPKFSKLSFDFRWRKLTDLDRQIDFRLFAGTFLFNKTQGVLFSFALDKSTDYLFDYNYLGRSEKTGFLSQQIIINEGGFKSKVSQSFANQWVLATNQSISIWRYFEVYSDLGLVKNNGKKMHFLYDGGLRLNIAHELFEVYFPFYSNNSWEIAQHHYTSKIRFILTTDIASFIKVVKRGFF